jgi:aminobenzoyl-glutamate utilization protein B
MTAQGKSSVAHKGMVHVAKVMAATAVDVLSDPELLARARRDHAARLADVPMSVRCRRILCRRL